MVFVAQLGGSAALLLNSVVLARQWGPASYGTLTTLFNITTFAVGVTDFGIGITLVRLVGKYRSQDSDRYKYLLTMIMGLEALIGVSLVLLGVMAAPYLSELLFHTSIYVSLVRVSLITAGVVAASMWIPAVLQAHQRFEWFAVWTFAPIWLRVAGMIGATLYFRSLSAVVWAYLMAALCSAIIGGLVMVRIYIRPTSFSYPSKKATHWEVFHFTKWIAATIILGTLANRLDVFLLAARSDPTQVGIYAVAAQLIILAPLVVNTLNSTLMPRVSTLRSRAEYKRYLKQSSGITLLTSAGLTILLALGSVVIRWLYGAAFLPAVPVFRLLLVGYILTILAWPYMLLAYALDRPDIFAKVNVFQVIVQVSGNLILIPVLGAKSPGLMFLIITVLGLGIMGAWITLIYRRHMAEKENFELRGVIL